MSFIDRENERSSFKNNYQVNMQNNINQVYIIEADHGIGKTEFIREVSKYFSNFSLEINGEDNYQELSIFKSMVLELDKASYEHTYDDFKSYYEKKINNNKAFNLLFKVTALFGQALAKRKNLDINFESLIGYTVKYDQFILNAQTENLFEYAEYVFESVNMNIIFPHAKLIDSGSLNLISQLIVKYAGNIFIFESDNNDTSLKIEQYLKNSHKIFFKKYILNKLSGNHIEEYINQLLSDLKLEAKNIDSSILKDSIKKGDLDEIESILKDFNNRLEIDNSSKMRSIKEIILNLSNSQNAALILINYTNGKLNSEELTNILNDLDPYFSWEDINFLLDKNLIEQIDDTILMLPFVTNILNEKEFMQYLKSAVSSAFIRNLNKKLNKEYNSRYVDILVDYYLNNNQFYQLKTLITLIDCRLKNFNTQSERIDYFQKFVTIRHGLQKYNSDILVDFAKLAYNSNLYTEAMQFIELIDFIDDDIIFIKALVLNRCEKFKESKKYINNVINNYSKQSSVYFNLSLILIMDLIQLNQKEEAYSIYNIVKSYTNEVLYPYLIRISNVFCDDYLEKLNIVKSITDTIYKTNNSEFCGLHAIYLAYSYALADQPEMAEKSLLDARTFFGNNLLYNNMILHNEATIKFHKQDIDDEIVSLLNNAKITTYDEYDRFAINNNLLVYYILSDNISCFDCYKIVQELESMLKKTDFVRFIDKIYYNLYFYYSKMYNMEKSEHYRLKLSKENILYSDTYKYKLMYETSWKLPINIKMVKN